MKYFLILAVAAGLAFAAGCDNTGTLTDSDARDRGATAADETTIGADDHAAHHPATQRTPAISDTCDDATHAAMMADSAMSTEEHQQMHAAMMADSMMANGSHAHGSHGTAGGSMMMPTPGGGR